MRLIEISTKIFSHAETRHQTVVTLVEKEHNETANHNFN